MSQAKVANITNLAGTKTITTDDLIDRAVCRAWVNFNGTGTVAIRASFNVTSITDNGTGDYTVNFTNAMPDANYCVTTSAVSQGTFQTSYDGTVIVKSGTTPSTTSVTVQFAALGSNLNYSGQRTDLAHVYVAVFR